MGWLAGWAKRVKITIDHLDIASALSSFPVLIYLSTSSGRNGDDVSFVFDELGSDVNRKKIAVTKADGTTQCYVEIEHWDHANEEAWLWVKVPDVSSTVDTDIYLYYDSSNPDNTDYVGDPSDAVVHNVWDDNFKLVTHMRDDPDNSHIRDSTVNANDGTKLTAGEPAVTVDGKIGDAQEFDGDDDYVQLGDVIDFGAADSFTLECWMKSTESIAAYRNFIRKDNYMMGGTRKIYMLASYAEKATGLIYDGTKIPSITGDTNIHTGALFHVVFVRDVGEDKLKLYVNGASDALDVTDSTTTTLVNDGWLALGAWANPSGKGEYFDGILDEVRISNTVRTPAWIKASYESQRDHLNDFGSEEPRIQEYTRSASAAIGLVSVSGRSGAFTRLGIGAFDLAGQPDRLTDITRSALSIIEVDGISDREFIGERSNSGTVGLTGVTARLMAAFRGSSASFTVTGVPIRAFEGTRSVSAAFSLSGVAAGITGIIRRASATIGMTATGIRSWVGTRTASGVVVTQGTPSRILSAFRSAMATFMVNSTAVYIKSIFRSASASLEMTGNTNRILYAFRLAVAIMGITGTAFRGWIGSRSASGIMTIIGMSARMLHGIRSAFASISQTANTIRVIALIREASGSVSIQGIPSRMLSALRSADSTFSSSAVATRNLVLKRSQAASITLVAMSGRIIILLRSAVASINIEAVAWVPEYILRNIVTLHLAGKNYILDLADKEKFLRLPLKTQVLDIADKIRKLKLGKKVREIIRLVG